MYVHEAVTYQVRFSDVCLLQQLHRCLYTLPTLSISVQIFCWLCSAKPLAERDLSSTNKKQHIYRRIPHISCQSIEQVNALEWHLERANSRQDWSAIQGERGKVCYSPAVLGIAGFNKLVAANDVKICVPGHVFSLWRNSKIYFSNQQEIIISAQYSCIACLFIFRLTRIYFCLLHLLTLYTISSIHLSHLTMLANGGTLKEIH